MSLTKKRVIVLTDISSLRADQGEPDDTQSLIRYLLYANEFQTEGLIATYTKHGERAYPEHIHAVLARYALVEDSLKHHDDGYPSAAELSAVTVDGNPRCGLDQMGDGKDTNGSNLIVNAARRVEDGPLWILIWGGSLDLAQALYRLRTSLAPDELRRVLSSLHVYAIGDQYDDCGPWIRQQFPDLFYIRSGISFRGMYRGGIEALTSAQWVKANICNGTNPLGDLYPVYDGGDPWGHVSGVKEGDTPSFLYLLPSSWSQPDNPEEEHWGGQFRRVAGNYYSDLFDDDEAKNSVSKWREDYQADFARRMKRCERRRMGYCKTDESGD